MKLAAQYEIDAAPFWIVEDARPEPVVYTSALRLIRSELGPKPVKTTGGTLAVLDDMAITRLDAHFSERHPSKTVRWGLETFGGGCAIAFSGAEDVILIDMAVRTGLPFRVFTLDTGRLHPETYEYLELIRTHYGIEVELFSPDAPVLEAFVRAKGLFSFMEDGHKECCGVRKVEPLRRALAPRKAWITGQRKDQSPTRAEVATIQVDATFKGAGDQGRLIKLNPLAGFTSQQVWEYIRAHEVPYNPLHDRGFKSIGCAPCTRPTNPGEHERAGRWWWEEATKKECGLHISNIEAHDDDGDEPAAEDDAGVIDVEDLVGDVDAEAPEPSAEETAKWKMR